MLKCLNWESAVRNLRTCLLTNTLVTMNGFPWNVAQTTIVMSLYDSENVNKMRGILIKLWKQIVSIYTSIGLPLRMS